MEKKLSPVDYVIIVVTLMISSGIGLYYRFTGGRQKTTEEFFVANRNMSVTTIAIGLMVSYLSAVSLLGVSSEIYTYGTHYMVIVLGYIIATPFISYLYLPVFFKLGATSAFEYLQQRFGTETRVIASLAFLLQFLLYTGVVVYAPALALEATTGLSTTLNILIISVVCTFYSTIGGIKAVLITDVFQALLMIISIGMVIIQAAVEAGGIGEIWKMANRGGRIDFASTTLDPTVRHTWWNLLVGGFFTYLGLYAVNQVQVQRLLTIRTLEGARKALWWTLPITILTIVGIGFSGLAVYAKYAHCDPLTSTKIHSNDQLIPYYIMETLSAYPGIPGLFIAGIFSAGLSTISAVQNSVAVIVLEDYIKPLCKFRGLTISEDYSGRLSKFLAFIMGFVCMAVAFLAQYLGNGLLQAALTIFGVAGGPLLGLYTLGMFIEFANQYGAIGGLIGSLALSLWMGFGYPKPPTPKLPIDVSQCALNITLNSPPQSSPDEFFYLYRISYTLYGCIGVIFCLILGILISLVTNYTLKTPSQSLNPDLFTPFIANRIKKQRQYQQSDKNTQESAS